VFNFGSLRTNCASFTGTGCNLIETGEVTEGEVCREELDSSGGRGKADRAGFYFDRKDLKFCSLFCIDDKIEVEGKAWDGLP
jgi:hypothetical protein